VWKPMNNEHNMHNQTDNQIIDRQSKNDRAK
jgi:hypothetical protein